MVADRAQARAQALAQVLVAVLALVLAPVRIPTQSGRGFRFEAGHRSDLIPATIPI